MNIEQVVLDILNDPYIKRNEDLYKILRFMYITGARVSDAVNLQDYKFMQDGFVFMFRQHKNKRFAILELTQDEFEELQRITPPPYIAPKQVERAIKYVLTGYKQPNIKRVLTHSFRHAKAVRIGAKNGIMDALGIADDTTRHYLKFKED